MAMLGFHNQASPFSIDAGTGLCGDYYIPDMRLPEENRPISRWGRIIEQMKVAEGVTEDLKAKNQMAWVGAMNSIRNRAEKIVWKDLCSSDPIEIFTIS